MPAGLCPAAVFLHPLEHIQQRRAEIPLRLCSHLHALQQILSRPLPGRSSFTIKPSQQNSRPRVKSSSAELCHRVTPRRWDRSLVLRTRLHHLSSGQGAGAAGERRRQQDTEPSTSPACRTWLCSARFD